MKKKLEVEIELVEVWTTGKEKKITIEKCKSRKHKVSIMEEKRI